MIKYKQKFGEATPAGFDGIFDWDFLRPAFAGTKIEPMDFDAVVERRGNFIVMETKDPGVKIPQGQKITLENLVLLGEGKVVVLVIYGKTPQEITGLECWTYINGRCNKTIYEESNSKHVLAHVKSWFEWCNKV